MVEGGDDGVGDAVGGAPDGGTEVGCWVGDVGCGVGEGEDYVLGGDGEGLEEGAMVEEGEGWSRERSGHGSGVLCVRVEKW